MSWNDHPTGGFLFSGIPRFVAFLILCISAQSTASHLPIGSCGLVPNPKLPQERLPPLHRTRAKLEFTRRLFVHRLQLLSHVQQLQSHQVLQAGRFPSSGLAGKRRQTFLPFTTPMAQTPNPKKFIESPGTPGVWEKHGGQCQSSEPAQICVYNICIYIYRYVFICTLNQHASRNKYNNLSTTAGQIPQHTCTNAPKVSISPKTGELYNNPKHTNSLGKICIMVRGECSYQTLPTLLGSR